MNELTQFVIALNFVAVCVLFWIFYNQQKDIEAINELTSEIDTMLKERLYKHDKKLRNLEPLEDLAEKVKDYQTRIKFEKRMNLASAMLEAIGKFSEKYNEIVNKDQKKYATGGICRNDKGQFKSKNS